MKRSFLFALTFLFVAACGDDPSGPNPNPDPDPDPDPDSVPALPVLGHGVITDRYTAEVAVSGNTAYTTTWSFRQAAGNIVNIWDVSGDVPLLVDTLLVPGANTLGDVQISPDGALMVVAVEFNGAIVIYDRSDARAPSVITRYTSDAIAGGVHTVKLGVVDGTLYAFLQIDPRPEARLVILDLSDPAEPVQVLDRAMGNPYVHDVFVRDGILFAAVWDDGMHIYDIGGGDLGGTPANPLLIGDIVLGEIHNIWWFHDPSSDSKRYAFLGQEGPGSVPSATSSGDIHVVDISDMSDPVYVARYRLPGAGTHNFSMDEESGILYAAYYNGGVRALDVRGDLSACADDQRTNGVCDLALMGREVGFALDGDPFVWGVAFQGTHVYASDMRSGLFKLDVSELIR